MFCILLLFLGSATITLQETTDGFSTLETNPVTYTTAQLPSADETFPTFETTVNFPVRFPKSGSDATSCKNHFLCPPRRKSTLSKGFPQIPSKNLVPPFTDSEEELTTTEGLGTAQTVAETERTLPTTLFFRSSKTPLVLKKRDNVVSAARSTEFASFPSPTKLTPSAAQIDLSYLPPQGVLPAAAAANLDITRVNYLPPLEETAAAQTDARRAKPEVSRKDICSDAFHSFLCVPLKSRKRITGALPNSLIPGQQVRTSFNPAASNTVQSTVKPEPSETKQFYLPPSTTTTITTTTPAYAPQPSNVDRSYLPPSPKIFSASPSFNSVRIASEIPKITDRKAFSFTSTPRPFIQTSIIPYISPKVFEQIATTTEKPKPKPTPKPTPPPKLSPAPSNEVNRGYLPPTPFQNALPIFQQKPKTTTVRIFTQPTATTPTYSLAPSNTDNRYLPPSQKIEPAAAAQVDQTVVPAQQHQHHDHHDHHDHHHHHGRDLCTDPFHSFLCAPLKQRKRITGALPPGFNPQSSNRKETRVKPITKQDSSPILKPANTFQSETRVRPTEEIPAANALAPQSIGYQYPKPSPAFPLPSQTSPTFIRPTTTPKPFTGYSYPKPSSPLLLPTQKSVEVVPKEDRLSPIVVSPGYQYPKPSNPLVLPTQQSVEVIPKEDRLSSTVVSPGYQYPKPSVPFPLPSESRQSTNSKPVSPMTTPKPLQPQPSDRTVGYQYPKPAQPFPEPTGYQYPRPEKQLLLPTEKTDAADAPTLASLRNLGSAEFIPVNKIDAKRQVRTGTYGVGPRFGERLRTKIRQGAL